MTLLIRPYGDTHWHDLRLPGLEAVLGAKGFGLPEIEYLEQRGYKQHGTTILDWRFKPRTVTLDLFISGNDYAAYRASRMAVWELIRPNRGGALTIRRVYPNGDWRDVDCWFRGGGDGGEGPDNPIFRAEDLSLEFRCPNPSFYDPHSKTATLSGSTPAGLVFPAQFGAIQGAGSWVFHRANEFGVATCVYTGTFRSYPVITITGPYTTMRLENQNTGAVILLGVAVGAGGTRTLDIEAGTLVNEYGQNVFTDLALANLVDFYLAPDSTTTILISATDTDITTTVSVEYYERYIAL